MDQQTFETIFKEHINIETSIKSIENLFSPRMTHKIDYSPYYQRNYVWDDAKATHFIESIFLGTELPPLIFFNNDEGMEVIDGRQRYETMKRFMEDKFMLKESGLTVLHQLKNLKYSSLDKKSNSLHDHFVDCNIRMIEFRIVNHPPLEIDLQDKIKKEIFLRYNSGITPLKKEEIEDARYDKDELSNYFKRKLNNVRIHEKFQRSFFTAKRITSRPERTAKILSRVRTMLVLPNYPIDEYSRGGASKIIEKLYEYFTTNLTSEEIVSTFNKFMSKTEFLDLIIDIAKKDNLKINHLGLRAIYWAISVCEKEEKMIKLDKKYAKLFSDFLDKNSEFFSTEYSTRRVNILNRYIVVQHYFEELFDIDLSLYVDEKNNRIKKLKEEIKTKKITTKLDDIKTMGLTKPEPSNKSIEDVSRRMRRQKFLVRPTYQREEVIDKQKKSSIIESVLLNIKIPPIFIYKRTDEVDEVVDGQQRLLTLLGFTGAEYLDQNGRMNKSKDNNFKLQGLRILTELNGMSFKDLSDKQQDKIFDFQLYIVEIDAEKNPTFNPIDLFIRLNDKPYPIKINSFEMWNSWVDVSIINEIKKLKNRNYPWFSIKTLTKKSDRDRMENEELITTLAYVEYLSSDNCIDIYQKDNIELDETKKSRLIARLNSKKKVNQLLIDSENDDKAKDKFVKSIKKVNSVIKNLSVILIDRDSNGDKKMDFLNKEIDILVKSEKTRKLQNFYLLWILINKLNFSRVKFQRNDMKKSLIKIFKFINQWHTNVDKTSGNKDLPSTFDDHKQMFLSNFQSNMERKIRLTDEQKLEMIKEQGGKSSLSKAPIYDWDEIEVDHGIPLAMGGEDKIENLGISHKQENRKKGSKLN